jgi:uncharacterized protein YbjT (DUF2867 family)
MTTTVLVAGATGMLGSRIATHLLNQDDTAVRLLLRERVPSDAGKAATVQALIDRGATVAVGDVTDPGSLATATEGVDTVLSALQGGEAIIVDGQVALAEAAAANGVRRFLTSDFAIDLFAATEVGPQFEVRRRADAAIDALPMEVVHVLNGAFMDGMLDPTQPGLLDVSRSTVTLWGTGDEPFDVTTVEDTARFAARVATDPQDRSGIRYVSGSRTTWNEVIALTEELTGRVVTRTVVGDADSLRETVAQAEDPWSVVMPWYMLAMLTTPPFPTTENDRYPEVRPTTVQDYLATAHAAMTKA